MAKVSIIIPTYKDWDRLALCLKALTEQTLSPDMFEVIVVNNAVNDEVPNSYVVSHNCIIINEPKPGSYAARNAGLNVAKGEIIGFTDSDCVPDKDWIKNAIIFLENNPNVSRIGGAVKVFSKSKKPGKIELYDMMFAFPQYSYVQAGVSVTANMFSYRKVFDAVGFFIDNTMSGGDFELGKRADDAGFRIGYASDVVINHPARDSFQELIKKARRVGKGQVNYTPGKAGFMKTVREIIFTLKPKTWEVKRIFQSAKDQSFYNKICLVGLRHVVLWSKDFSRISAQLAKVDTDKKSKKTEDG